MARASLSIFALLALLGSVACTETDDAVVTVGVTRLSVTDTSLRVQDLSGSFLQAADWTIQRAELQAGGRVVDLLAGSSCVVQNTARILPLAIGKCAAGIVIDTNSEPLAATLTLRTTMTVRRAEPANLPPGGDFDMDGVTNSTDICPLISDPGQEDADMNGLGDACEATSPITLLAGLDSDADGVTDDVDNCAHIANDTQVDSSSPVDGIGDACVEQSATVQLNMSTDLDLNLPLGNLIQGERQSTFLIVDFLGSTSLTCDFTAQTCTLDAALVEACITSDFVTGVTLGCP